MGTLCYDICVYGHPHLTHQIRRVQQWCRWDGRGGAGVGSSENRAEDTVERKLSGGLLDRTATLKQVVGPICVVLSTTRSTVQDERNTTDGGSCSLCGEFCGRLGEKERRYMRVHHSMWYNRHTILLNRGKEGAGGRTTK